MSARSRLLPRPARIAVVMTLAAVTVLLALPPAPVTAQDPAGAGAYVPSIGALLDLTGSELRGVVDRFSSDRAGLTRRYHIDDSGERSTALGTWYRSWLGELATMEFERLGIDGRIDHILLRNHLDYQLLLLEREAEDFAETEALIPFATTIIRFQEARRRMEEIDPVASAGALEGLREQVEAIQKALDAGLRRSRSREQDDTPAEAAEEEADEEGLEPVETTITLAYRAARLTDGIRRTLRDWFEYYDGYHPLFSWWAEAPYQKTADALEGYAKFLREKVVGYKEGEDPPVVGDPIGRDALLVDLAHELIAYTPEELVAIANREFAWCEAEMLRAAGDLGYGDDWRAALEHVKGLHVDPGDQPALIRELALEAIDFVTERGLLTVPELARDIWRIEMMSPERQKVSPFFLGGEVIQVSFPTDEMDHDLKLMSMRGNNRHFAKATVHHELIPGHHLQGFMTDRYNRHRRTFGTPFWSEGWALYWEMLLWDKGFPQSPEDRIGMLFWRMHRCARIIFSLGFQLETMTPQECIDFLVDRVGHERANAEAEVRRSFEGSYSPLYQLAYMIGGLQFRALHEELVDTGLMTDRAFHDAILQMGSMPVELVRARLLGIDLPEDFVATWRFAGELPGR